MRLKYYFNGGIETRWKHECANLSNKILVFSPYLTPDTALEILEAIKDEYRQTSEIYTKFSVQDFVTGSSSLTTLKQLDGLGLNLYEIKNLHAKLIIIPQQFASIGSQNLTYQGTQNKEANVVITDPIEVNAIENEVNQWIMERIPITKQRIEEIEQIVEPLQQDYEELHEKIQEGQQEIDKKVIRHKPIIKIAKEFVQTKVKKIESRYTLLAGQKSNLTAWIFEDQEVNLLSNFQRYLCFNKRYNKWGFVRLCKSRITFVCDGLTRTKLIKLQNKYFAIQFKFRWGFIEEKKDNIKIILKIYEDSKSKLLKGKLILYCDFILSPYYRFEIKDIKFKNKSSIEQKILDFLETDSNFFNKLIINQIAKPFYFQKKLIGSEANTFFGEEETEYTLRVGKINDYFVLIAE